jgi:hypothetical protein
MISRTVVRVAGYTRKVANAIQADAAANSGRGVRVMGAESESSASYALPESKPMSYVHQRSAIALVCYA